MAFVRPSAEEEEKKKIDGKGFIRPTMKPEIEKPSAWELVKKAAGTSGIEVIGAAVGEIKRKVALTPEERTAELTEFAQTPTGALGYGLTGGVSKFILPGEKGKELFAAAQEAQPTTYGVGAAAGSLGKYATLYTSIGPTIAKIPALKKLGTGVIGTLTTELAKDIAIGLPIGVLDSLSENKRGKELIADAAKNLVIDAVANAAFYGLGKGVQAISKAYATRKAIKLPGIIETLTKKAEDISIKKVVAPEIKPEKVIAPDVRKSPISEYIQREPVKEKKSFRKSWVSFREKFVDRNAQLEEAEKILKGKIPSAEKSLYKTARLYPGWSERADEIIRSELEPIIKSIEKKGLNVQDLGDYALAKHTADVNKLGIKTGIPDDVIQKTLQQYEGTIVDAEAKKLVEISNRLLDDLVEANVLAKYEVDAMRKRYPNYVPLFRHFEDDKVEFARTIRETFANIGEPIMALKGSKRKIIDPVESMIKNIYKYTNVSARSKVGMQIPSMAEADKLGRFVRLIGEGEDVARKNVLDVNIDGKKVKYEVTPELFRTMNSLDKESSNTLMKILSMPASVLRAGAVLTPQFAMRNPFRDIFHAFQVSESGFNPITDFAAGLAGYIKKDELFQKFMRSGAGFGNIVSMDRGTNRKILNKIIKQPVTKKFVTVVDPRSWLELLRKVSDATETATKMGEFRAALRKGVTPEEAAFRARDIMDFARKGTISAEVNKVVAFFNAPIQGRSKLLRAIRKNPGKVGSKLLISMALPSLGAYAITAKFANEKQKATIADAPAWLRDTFWLIPVPGTDVVARLPKPFDASIVSNVLERFLDYTMKEDKAAFDTILEDTIAQQSIPVLPTAMLPIIEGVANYSFFRKAPVIPKREEYLERGSQADVHTSVASKKLAGLIEGMFGSETNFSSPRIVENTIRGYTAGLGGYALDVIDAIAGTGRPAKGITQQPLIKAFTVSEGATGKSTDYLYKEKARLTKEKNTAKLEGKLFKDSATLSLIERYTDQISDLSADIRKISNDPVMTPARKRDLIKAKSDKRNEIAREGYKTAIKKER